MGAGAETPGGGTEGQALDIKEFSPRVSRGDLIVFTLALLLVAGGSILKQIHDKRTVSAEVGGLRVAYPRGWFRYPAEDPELFRAVSNQDGDTTLLLFADPTGPAGLLGAIVSGVGNPAGDQTAYVQLANEQVEWRGNVALRTDYAYVNTAVRGASPPEVIRGRQIAWIMDDLDDQVYKLALESPDDLWDEANGIFEPIVDQLEI